MCRKLHVGYSLGIGCVFAHFSIWPVFYKNVQHLDLLIRVKTNFEEIPKLYGKIADITEKKIYAPILEVKGFRSENALPIASTPRPTIKELKNWKKIFRDVLSLDIVEASENNVEASKKSSRKPGDVELIKLTDGDVTNVNLKLFFQPFLGTIMLLILLAKATKFSSQCYVDASFMYYVLQKILKKMFHKPIEKDFEICR